MKTVVNLRQIRKQRARSDAKKIADENAVRHGLTKAQRLLDAAQNRQVRDRLDAQRFDDTDG